MKRCRVAVRVAESDLAALDAAIERGSFANRSDALRVGLGRILRDARDQEIAEAYRRGYGAHPQEEWIGEVGFAALVALDRAERGES